MGFCYPGKGKSGDLPPRPECRQTWHPRLLPLLDEVRLTVLIGQYAQAYFLGARRRGTLTETVHAWRDYAPERSEEHTSELQSLMRISYAVFCLKKKTHQTTVINITISQ